MCQIVWTMSLWIQQWHQLIGSAKYWIINSCKIARSSVMYTIENTYPLLDLMFEYWSSNATILYSF